MVAMTSASSHGKRPKRARYRGAKAFYWTLLLLTCFATLALFTRHQPGQADLSATLRKRGNVGASSTEEEKCRLVHRSQDQCRFVHTNCPADEAGFTAYLDLYFCRLHDAKPVALIILISWLGLLFSTIGIAASDFFCINLSTISTLLGMSESMAGVTFLAFGNGSPDVFSTFAAMGSGSGSLAVGELIGAAGFITAVVAGSMALIRPFQVARKSFIRDVGFFVVAASFSMTFLSDGRLQLWECVAMVLFYIFYVCFVVAWHWWLGRRRRRREREAAARGHYLPPASELDVEDDVQEYQDDPSGHRRESISRGVSQEEFAALERGVPSPYEDERTEDEEEEDRDRWMSELNSNMRLSRMSRSRRNTLTPVRPSLVGALEFQAVMKGLQKSRNIQGMPMHTRRYSDDPTFTTAQQQGNMSSPSDTMQRPPYELNIDTGTQDVEHNNAPLTAPARLRAITVTDPTGLGIGVEHTKPDEDSESGNLIDLGDSELRGAHQTPQTLLHAASRGQPSQLQIPGFRLSQASPRPELPRQLSALFGPPSPDHLAVPGEQSPFGQVEYSSHSRSPRLNVSTPQDSPSTKPQSVPRARQLPKIQIPRERPRSGTSTPMTSPFPAFFDDPSPAGIGRPPELHLPPPASSEPLTPADDLMHSRKQPTRWWPYGFLPPPGIVFPTLFPTICNWSGKTIWEKMLGVVAAPSVLLLTITLPVVELTQDEDGLAATRKDDSYTSAHSGQTKSPLVNVAIDQSPGDYFRNGGIAGGGAAGRGNTASVAIETERREHGNYGTLSPDNTNSAVSGHRVEITSSPIAAPASDGGVDPNEGWNRWLTIVHIFVSPIFCVLSIYVQASDELEPQWLIKPIAICLGLSVVLVVVFILTTTTTRRPPIYQTILSLAGFVVSIAWISAVASQVVGALKALAVILNMSHAIMGLTIFAVGNSLGDLVADVTVARLGYPVMALSACFGGPMLNILLGIGLSGSYILIRGAEHRHDKHPDRGYKFKSYEIEVATTLIISGITLLVTLVGLLVIVPLNKWTFSKRIGWALIALWLCSTVVNVILEIVGVGETDSER